MPIVDSARHHRAEAQMPRASWKGFLRLSLVSCPMYLSPATTRTKSIRLHQVWQPNRTRAIRPSGLPRALSVKIVGEDTAPERMAAARVNLLPHDPHTDAEIERSEVVKGYECERRGFVTFTAEELKALDVESSENHRPRKFRAARRGPRSISARPIMSIRMARSRKRPSA
jgi:hypothetical protein